MPNYLGSFLGGAAGGLESGFKTVNEAQNLSARTGFMGRETAVHEQALQNTIQQQALTQNEKLVAETMGVVGEFVKQGLAANRDPATIYKSVEPMIDSLAPNLRLTGRSVEGLKTSVRTQVGLPSGVEAATGAGAGQAAQTVTFQTEAGRGLTEPLPANRPGLPAAPAAAPAAPGATAAPATAPAGGSGLPQVKSIIIDPKERVTAETELRKEYQAHPDVKNFNVVRDNYENINNAKNTTVGDMARVYGLMRMIDPTMGIGTGEPLTAQQMASMPGPVRNMVNFLQGNPKAQLGDTERGYLKEQADAIFAARAKVYNDRTQYYAGVARDKGVGPKNVVDFNPAALIAEARSLIAKHGDAVRPGILLKLKALGVTPPSDLLGQ